MYYLVVKKSEIMKITGRWTALEAITQSEVTNTQKNQHSCFLSNNRVAVSTRTRSKNQNHPYEHP